MSYRPSGRDGIGKIGVQTRSLRHPLLTVSPSSHRTETATRLERKLQLILDERTRENSTSTERLPLPPKPSCFQTHGE